MFIRIHSFISVLVLLTLVLFLVMTSCAPSTSPTSLPSPSPETPAESSPPSSPEPPAPVLAELNLVAEPSNQKKLDVELVYSGADQPALCYLGAYAMLAKFGDSDIDFTDVVANSGIGASALYIPQVNILTDGSFLESIQMSARNQGFDYYLIAEKGAMITDDFMCADLPKDAKQVLWVENRDAAFELLKRLISTDIPVEVHLDLYPIREPLTKHTSYMQTIFNYMGARHADHYFTVTGYDDSFVYLNDPTEKAAGMGKDIPINISGFLSAWVGSDPSMAASDRIGPYWMLFLGKRGTAKSANELLSWNKDIAAKAPGEIRKAADNPNIDGLLHCSNMYRARKEFGLFLKGNGHIEAGNMFLEASELFRGLCQSSNPKADLLKIADLQEQALTKW